MLDDLALLEGGRYSNIRDQYNFPDDQKIIDRELFMDGDDHNTDTYRIHNQYTAISYVYANTQKKLVLNPPEQILGSYCGFSPIAADGRFHPLELYEEITNNLNVNLDA